MIKKKQEQQKKVEYLREFELFRQCSYSNAESTSNKFTYTSVASIVTLPSSNVVKYNVIVINEKIRPCSANKPDISKFVLWKPSNLETSRQFKADTGAFRTIRLMQNSLHENLTKLGFVLVFPSIAISLSGYDWKEFEAKSMKAYNNTALFHPKERD